MGKVLMQPAVKSRCFVARTSREALPTGKLAKRGRGFIFSSSQLLSVSFLAYCFATSWYLTNTHSQLQMASEHCIVSVKDAKRFYLFLLSLKTMRIEMIKSRPSCVALSQETSPSCSARHRGPNQYLNCTSRLCHKSDGTPGGVCAWDPLPCLTKSLQLVLTGSART